MDVTAEIQIPQRSRTHSVVTGSVVLYWAVLFRRGVRWSLAAVQTTGGDEDPHTPANILRIVQADHGPVAELAIAGPYWDRESPQQVLTMAESDAVFAGGWAGMAHTLHYLAV